MSFGAAAGDCAVYPGAGAAKALAKDLLKHDASKGTIRFPADRPLPATVVRRIVQARLAERRRAGRRTG